MATQFKAPELKPLITPQASMIQPGKASPLSTRTHIESLTGSDSQYITNARQQAQAYANRRGMLNSTLAGAAGEAAAIERALPIASEDAGYNRQLGAMTHQGNITGSLATHQGNITGALTGYGSELEKDRMRLGTELERGTMSHADTLEQGRMRLGSGLEQGRMSHGAELESGLLGRREELQRGTMELANSLETQRMRIAEELERGNITHRVAEGLRADLELQASQQANLLERIYNENHFALTRMDREQRHRIEQTMLGATNDLQKLAIAEMGAINRTEGLTPEQQQGAIADVERRTQAHIKYLQNVAQVSPTWDPLFEGLPSFDVGGGTAVPAAPATPAQPLAPAAQESVDQQLSRSP